MCAGSPKYQSPYRYSSRLGAWMGLYLLLMSACILSSVRCPDAVLMLFPLLLGLPFVLYALMRAVWTRAPHLHTVGGIWLVGIWIFIFGALICGALTAAWIILFDPEFVEQYIRASLEAVDRNPALAQDYAQATAQMRSVLDAGAVPSPMQFVFTMIWTTSFFGSVLSFLAALLLKARSNKHPFCPY